MFVEPFPRGSLPVPKPMRERVDNKQTKYDFQYGEASKQKTPRESEVRKYCSIYSQQEKLKATGSWKTQLDKIGQYILYFWVMSESDW